MTTLKKPGAGLASRISRRQVLDAARRYYDVGETQAEIAKDLGISASYLARLLKQAKDSGWVRVFIDTDRELELAAAIKAKYPHLRHVEVVPSGPTPEATARDIATAQAEWFNNLLDEDEERDEPMIKKVAIGGAWTHRLMVEQVVRRRNRVSVGPTALTPFRGKVARWNATTVATELALRLGALEPGQPGPEDPSRKGYLYNMSVDPPTDSLAALRDWFAQLQERPEYQEMLGFWSTCDVVFVSAVGIDHVYEDVRERLGKLGLSVEAMKERGAVAVMGNRFVDAQARTVPLAEGMVSYEPGASLMQPEHGKGDETKPHVVVVDNWGMGGAPLDPRSGETMFTDVTVASAIVGNGGSQNLDVVINSTVEPR